jgi:hypothetical protein
MTVGGRATSSACPAHMHPPWRARLLADLGHDPARVACDDVLRADDDRIVVRRIAASAD